MKKLQSFIFLLITNFYCTANNPDLEIKKLEEYKDYCLENINKVEGIERVKLYENLSYYYHLKYFDKVKQKYYIDEAINYSHSINDEYCLSYSILINNLWDFSVNQKNNTLKILNALELGKKTENHEAVLRALNCLAFYNARINNFQDTENYLKLASLYINKFNLSKFEYFIVKSHIYNSYIKDYTIARNTIKEFNEYFNKNKENINLVEKFYYLCNIDIIINGLNLANNTKYILMSNSNRINFYNFEYYIIRKKYFNIIKKIKENKETKEEVDSFIKSNKLKIKKNELFDFFNKSIEYEYLFKAKKYDQFLQLFNQKTKETSTINYEFQFKNEWFFELYNNSNINKEDLFNMKLNIEQNFKNTITQTLNKKTFSKIQQEHYLYYIEKENKKIIYIYIFSIILVLIIISFKFLIKKR
jgi:hypothetical protein